MFESEDMASMQTLIACIDWHPKQCQEGALEFHRLQVWPILALGFQVLARRFIGLEMCCGFGQFLCSSVGYVIQTSYLWGFRGHNVREMKEPACEDSNWCVESMKTEIVEMIKTMSKNLMKIKGFCYEMRYRPCEV